MRILEMESPIDQFIAIQERKEETMCPDGYIYFMQIGDRIKIGFSRMLKTRMGMLYSKYKKEVKIIALLKGQPEIEKMMQRYFGKYRIEGEWFRPEPEIYKFAEKIRNQLVDAEWVIYHWRR